MNGLEEKVVTTETTEQTNAEFAFDETPEEIIVEQYNGAESKYTRSENVVAKNKAIAGGALGALVAGGLGFVGGAYYERQKRMKLMAIISTEMDTLAESNTPTIGLVEQMKKDICTALESSSISKKEKIEWETLFTRLINISAQRVLLDEETIIQTQLENENN